jgi:hypothetical protein
VPGTGIDLIVRSAASIGILGWRSLEVTTTLKEGLLDAAPAFRATRTKAAITSKARRIPRIVNGLLNVIALKRGLTADPS